MSNITNVTLADESSATPLPAGTFPPGDMGMFIGWVVSLHVVAALVGLRVRKGKPPFKAYDLLITVAVWASIDPILILMMFGNPTTCPAMFAVASARVLIGVSVPKLFFSFRILAVFERFASKAVLYANVVVDALLVCSCLVETVAIAMITSTSDPAICPAIPLEPTLLQLRWWLTMISESTNLILMIYLVKTQLVSSSSTSSSARIKALIPVLTYTTFLSIFTSTVYNIAVQQLNLEIWFLFVNLDVSVNLIAPVVPLLVSSRGGGGGAGSGTTSAYRRGTANNTNATPSRVVPVQPAQSQQPV